MFWGGGEGRGGAAVGVRMGVGICRHTLHLRAHFACVGVGVAKECELRSCSNYASTHIHICTHTHMHAQELCKPSRLPPLTHTHTHKRAPASTLAPTHAPPTPYTCAQELGVCTLTPAHIMHQVVLPSLRHPDATHLPPHTLGTPALTLTPTLAPTAAAAATAAEPRPS